MLPEYKRTYILFRLIIILILLVTCTMQLGILKVIIVLITAAVICCVTVFCVGCWVFYEIILNKIPKTIKVQSETINV